MTSIDGAHARAVPRREGGPLDTTLMKGLRVLEAVARSSTPRGASELARELGLTRSNAHRTLQTLAAAGYVRLSADGQGFECTVKLFELSSAVIERVDVRRCGQPHLRALNAETHATVHLSILDGTEVIYLEKIDGERPAAPAYSTIGGRAPAHCVASGKALLSRLPRAELARFMANGLPAWTERTITSPERLVEQLKTARETGVAVNRGEWRISVAGVAAVIFDARSNPVAAVGVSGPDDQILPNEAQLRTCVLQTARDISRELGCRSYPFDQ